MTKRVDLTVSLPLPDEATQTGVVGRMHIQEVGVQSRWQGQPSVIALTRMRLVQRQQRIGKACANVVEPGHEPGRLPIRSRDAVYRRGGPQPLIHVVWAGCQIVGKIHAPTLGRPTEWAVLGLWPGRPISPVSKVPRPRLSRAFPVDVHIRLHC